VGAGDDWTLFGIDWLTSHRAAVGSSGIAVAAMLGLLLDNLIPGTDAERGRRGPTTSATEYPVVPPEDMRGM
jgi:xanthine/uracil permease